MPLVYRLFHKANKDHHPVTAQQEVIKRMLRGGIVPGFIESTIYLETLFRILSGLNGHKLAESSGVQLWILK